MEAARAKDTKERLAGVERLHEALEAAARRGLSAGEVTSVVDTCMGLARDGNSALPREGCRRSPPPRCLPEMYRNMGYQFHEELQRHNLPAYMLKEINSRLDKIEPNAPSSDGARMHWFLHCPQLSDRRLSIVKQVFNYNISKIHGVAPTLERIRSAKLGAAAISYKVQMATKRKSPADHGGNSFSVRLGQHNNIFRFENFEDDKSVVLMEAHLEMMQKFINFCKEKESFKRNAFKEKLTTYFGGHLPSDIIHIGSAITVICEQKA
ncbi:unnamed protein product [Miscanthus lutarioriparius]|uniref:Uncharacterized protein n=1 Tax=Miscanthus lutarioriparius TaxID=422564 RepID=A0A811Q059_9POAL|nr:unnamed protein product [Miscanthus lutarioriparius]